MCRDSHTHTHWHTHGPIAQDLSSFVGFSFSAQSRLNHLPFSSMTNNSIFCQKDLSHLLLFQAESPSSPILCLPFFLFLGSSAASVFRLSLFKSFDFDSLLLIPLPSLSGIVFSIFVNFLFFMPTSCLFIACLVVKDSVYGSQLINTKTGGVRITKDVGLKEEFILLLAIET